MSCTTQELTRLRLRFVYGIVTFSDAPFQSASTTLSLALWVVLLPRCRRNGAGLGSSAFARHYLRNHGYFLFLRVLRCFSSPRLLTAWRYADCSAGCPIRISAGQGIFAPRRSFSQLITSFFASESLGILLSPLLPFFALLLRAGGIHTFALLVCSNMSMSFFVENNGFEPLTLCLQSRCSSQLS